MPVIKVISTKEAKATSWKLSGTNRKRLTKYFESPAPTIFIEKKNNPTKKKTELGVSSAGKVRNAQTRRLFQ